MLSKPVIENITTSEMVKQNEMAFQVLLPIEYKYIEITFSIQRRYRSIDDPWEPEESSVEGKVQ
jgi:hypothetical protein